MSLFHLCFNGFRAFAQSTTALVASALARKDHRRVRQVVTQAAVLAVGLGTLVATLLRGKGELALQLMGAPAGSELSRLGLPYLRIRALAAPCVLLLMVSGTQHAERCECSQWRQSTYLPGRRCARARSVVRATR